MCLSTPIYILHLCASASAIIWIFIAIEKSSKKTLSELLVRFKVARDWFLSGIKFENSIRGDAFAVQLKYEDLIQTRNKLNFSVG